MLFDKSMTRFIGSLIPAEIGIFINLISVVFSYSKLLSSSFTFVISSNLCSSDKGTLRSTSFGTSTTAMGVLDSSYWDVVLFISPSESLAKGWDNYCCLIRVRFISLSSLSMSELLVLVSFKFYFISRSSLTMSNFNYSMSSLES